ncbi:MAG: ATP-binding protein [Enhygromyxa sp.]
MALRPRRHRSPPALHAERRSASTALRAKLERLQGELDELRERVEEGQRVRQLADALPAFVAYVDAQRRYVFLNQFYDRRFCRPVSELCGRTVAEVLGPENYARARPWLEAALAGEQGHTEQRLTLPSGDSMYVDAAYVPDRRADGSIAGCFVMGVDITERKQAEELAREREERLCLAKDAVGLGIYDYDFRTDTARWDQRMRELWGLGLHEPITYERFLVGVHPQDRARLEVEMERATDPRSDGVFQIEHRVVARTGGSLRWVATAGKVTFEDEQPVRVVGTVQDITARKHAVDALRSGRQQLREAARRKDEFLAVLGHELRNPLAAICNASELLQLRGDDDPELAKIGEVLERQARQMVRLVDGLLDVSRVARGKIHLEHKLVDVRQVLEGVLHDRRQQLLRCGLQLDAQLSDQALWVWGDEVRLAQIFDNLLGNAIKFSAPSGSISVVARSCGAWVIVLIRDTGVGIRPDMLESIFDPFEQDRPEIARSTGGLGIGLALVRGLVELHGGSVVARSEGPDTGAEFEVRLPVSAWGGPDTAKPEQFMS